MMARAVARKIENRSPLRSTSFYCRGLKIRSAFGWNPLYAKVLLLFDDGCHISSALPARAYTKTCMYVHGIDSGPTIAGPCFHINGESVHQGPVHAYVYWIRARLGK